MKAEIMQILLSPWDSIDLNSICFIVDIYK